MKLNYIVKATRCWIRVTCAFLIPLLLYTTCMADNICDLLDKREFGELLFKGDFVDTNKRVVNIRNWRGKLTILYFWTTWSLDCIDGIKALNDIANTLEEKEEQDLNIIPIAIAERMKEIDGAIKNVKRVYELYQIDTLDQYLDINGQFYSELQKDSAKLPFIIIIDANGREIGRAEGKILSQVPHTTQLLKDIRACIN